MKNMKIEINKDQPLDDICKEVERLGYKPYQPYCDAECVYTWADGLYCIDKNMESRIIYKTVTLQQLREMK